ncbi:unnamed protein product [Blepharisma stoltei]|uniref:K Homology domain-containing protein n=1 Tax=Blepharisma stoltei TaxID=1481888 RepID=A0AAU9IHQ5_9CILI|nr:unnamed protein product [Blepharisma stoltei]
MRSWRSSEAEPKVLGMLFSEIFRDHLENLKQEVKAQSLISEIKIEDSKYFDNTFEVLITGDLNSLVSASSVIFSHLIADPLSETQMEILIPETSVGKIIGIEGTNISRIRENSRTKIAINKYSPTSQAAKIDGTFEGILKAVQQIIELIYEKPKRSSSLAKPAYQKRPNSAAPRPKISNKCNSFGEKVQMETGPEITKMITVPQSAVGWILGKHKAGLQKLEDRSGCGINLQDSVVGEMMIFEVTGQPNKVNAAMELIKESYNKLRMNEIDQNPEARIRKNRRNKGESEEDEEEEKKFIPRIKNKSRLNIRRNQKVVSLVIGQTGSGKSTFINYLTNFFRKGTLNNKKIAIPTKTFPNQTERDFKHTERLLSSDHSQTNNCCAYEFADPESSSTFTFIDSPGIGDTRGVDQDEENIQKIVSEVVNYPDINAIIIVQNGSEARNTTTVKYTLSKLKNSLPSLVEKNLILVLTNSAVSANFNVNSLQIVPRETFTMDNNAFNITNLQNLSRSQLHQLQLSWNSSMEKIKEIVEFISKMNTVNTKLFKEMWSNINIAKQNFHLAKLQLINLSNLKEKLENVRGQRELSLNEAIAYQNFKKTQTIEQTEWIDIPYYSTVCSNDDSLCHERWGLNYTPDKNSSIFTGCACMGRSPNCTVCKCGHNSHYHTNRIPRKVQKTVENILYDVKRQHDKHKARANELQIEESNCEKDLKNVENSIEDTKRKIRTAVQNLREIAPNYNMAEEIDGVLQQARMQLKIEKLLEQRTKTRLVIKVLEEIYNNLLG